MKKGKVEIVAILDKSGSMRGLEEDTIGGFNSFIKAQKNVDGECNVSLYLFDHEYDEIYSGLSLDEVPELTNEVYFPRGATALLDAVGKTINSVGNRLSNTPEEERPEQVIFIITTDGIENSSLEFDKSKILDMVNHQTEKYNWEFIFMGANIDAFGEGGSMGFAANNTVSYSADSRGTKALYAAAASAVLKKREDVNISLNMAAEYSAAFADEEE